MTNILHEQRVIIIPMQCRGRWTKIYPESDFTLIHAKSKVYIAKVAININANIFCLDVENTKSL